MNIDFTRNNKDKKITKWKKLKLLAAASCSLIPVTWYLGVAHAALLYPLNDIKVIKVEVSRQGLTRITVTDDRILNVFGITGEYVLETDEEQGQIFIRPMGQGSLNPISLTLTTEKGHTQDLCLSPIDKAPEALILEAEESSKEGSAKNRNRNAISRDEVEALIQAAQEDRIPVGYRPMPLDIIPKKTGPQHKEYQLIREIRGPHLKGLTYEVKNTSQIPLIMAEQSLAGPDVVAVYMPFRLLNTGEKTYVYVVSKITE